MMTTLASISKIAARRQPMVKALVRNLHHRHQPKVLPNIATTTNSSRYLHNNDSNTNSNIIDKDGYLQFDTLHQMITNATSAYQNNPLFGTFDNALLKNDNGSFHWMTYDEFAKNVTLCRTILKDLNVRPFSKVGIISNNRQEWAVIAAATYSLNATLVPRSADRCTPAAHLARADRLEWPSCTRRASDRYRCRAVAQMPCLSRRWAAGIGRSELLTATSSETSPLFHACLSDIPRPRRAFAPTDHRRHQIFPMAQR